MLTDGERRKLVFANLANGVTVEAVMAAFHRSAKEVMDDFAFAATKIRSYRFERGQPLVPCHTVADARANQATLLYTLARLNLDTQAKFSKIITLPLDGTPGRSPAELKLLEIQANQRR